MSKTLTSQILGALEEGVVAVVGDSKGATWYYIPKDGNYSLFRHGQMRGRDEVGNGGNFLLKAGSGGSTGMGGNITLIAGRWNQDQRGAAHNVPYDTRWQWNDITDIKTWFQHEYSDIEESVRSTDIFMGTTSIAEIIMENCDPL